MEGREKQRSHWWLRAVALMLLLVALGVGFKRGGQGGEFTDSGENSEVDEITRSDRERESGSLGKRRASYARLGAPGIRLVSRKGVGENWREVLETIPVRYDGSGEDSVEMMGGGSELKGVLDGGDFFFAVDLVCANYEWGDRRRSVFTDWLKQYRARLNDEEIEQNSVSFEHKGKMMALIGANHLYAVRLPERWLQKAEEEFFGDYEIPSEEQWNEAELLRGKTWMQNIGLDGESVRLGLTDEQWEKMENEPPADGILHLREDQLVRLVWLSSKAGDLLLREGEPK